MKKENEKCILSLLFGHHLVKERLSKLGEINAKYQELNDALSNELQLLKGKEQAMLQEEKRMRYCSLFISFHGREKVMDQFMVSLDELNVRVEDNSKANAVLIEENRVLREEYRSKVQHFQAQVQQGKDIIDKLTEINVQLFSCW